MPISYPNQKTVIVNREIPKNSKNDKRPYMIAYIDKIEAAAKNIHKPTSFKLYIYLISNGDQFTFALSTQDFADRYGVSLDSAKDAVNDLIALGYLVLKEKKTYQFFEEPITILDIDDDEPVKKTLNKKNGGTIELTYDELLNYFNGDKEKTDKKWRETK